MAASSSSLTLFSREPDESDRLVASAERQLGRGLPSRLQREVAPDPARLERAATLTNCGPGAPLPGGCVLGGFASDLTSRQTSADPQLCVGGHKGAVERPCFAGAVKGLSLALYDVSELLQRDG